MLRTPWLPVGGEMPRITVGELDALDAPPVTVADLDALDPPTPQGTTWRERLFKSGEETLADPSATMPERVLAGATVGGRSALNALWQSLTTPGELGAKIGEVFAAPFAYTSEAVKGGLEQAGVSRQALERTEKDIIGATPGLVALHGRPRPPRSTTTSVEPPVGSVLREGMAEARAKRVPQSAGPPESLRVAAPVETQAAEPSILTSVPVAELLPSPPEVVQKAVGKRAKPPSTVTIGTIGGAIQDALGYLPESIRTLPQRWEAGVDRVVAAIGDKIPESIKESRVVKSFRTARGLGDKWVDVMHDRGARYANLVERAIELGGDLQVGLSPAEKMRLDQVLRGGITTNPAIERIVKPTRDLINDLQAKLTKYGYLTPEQVEQFSERFRSHPNYLRRLYESKLLEPKEPIIYSGPQSSLSSPALMQRGNITTVKLPMKDGRVIEGKERLKFLQKKYLDKGYRLLKVEGQEATLFQDIPEGVRKQMGEIRDQPGFVAAKTIAEQARLVSLHEMFDAISKNPEWARKLETEAGPLRQQQLAMLESGDWVLLEGKKKFGPLDGHMVTKDVALELSHADRLRSDLQKIYDRVIGMWKFGRVLLSPAAIGRNTMSSAMLADFGGLHPYMIDEWVKGAKDLRAQGGYYTEAKEVGLFRSGFSQNEINHLADVVVRSPEQNAALRVLDGIHDIAVKAGEKTGIKPSKIYGAVENFYRYNLYRYGREALGLDPKEARRYALKYAIDYEVVSPATRMARSLPIVGAPFMTFASKAIPLTLETAVKHPLRVSKYVALIQGGNMLAQNVLQQQPEDVAQQRKLGELNPIRFMQLPFQDEYGRNAYLDFGYIFPYGDLLELTDALAGGEGRRANVGFLPFFSNPAATLGEVAFNKSLYSGRDIVGPADTSRQAWQKRVDYLAQSWLPSWTPPIPGFTTKGGYAWEDIRKSLKGEPDYFGRKRDLPSAVAANVAGLRAKYVSTPEVAQHRLREYNEKQEQLTKEAMRAAGKYADDPEMKKQELDRITGRMKEVAGFTKELFAKPTPTGAGRPGTQTEVRSALTQSKGNRTLFEQILREHGINPNLEVVD